MVDRGESFLKEVLNFYEEYEQRGENPKPFDLDDMHIRRRGREFKEREKRRQALQDEYQKTREKYKVKDDET